MHPQHPYGGGPQGYPPQGPYPHGYPQQAQPGYPYPPPPRPPPSGLSPLAIVLIVGGIALVLGGGACVVIGGLVLAGAAAEAEAQKSAPTAPTMPAPTDTSNTSTGGLGFAGEEDETDPEASDESDPSPSLAATGTSAAKGDDGRGTASKTGAAATPVWFCNASGSVMVCGFANVCNHQSVFGMGSGSDRYIASNSAKMACEGMARAKGGSTVCAVSCSLANKR